MLINFLYDAPFRNSGPQSYFIFLGQSLKKKALMNRFFVAFAKLREATISFVMSIRMSVCLSVRPRVVGQLAAGRIFVKFRIWYFY